MTDDKIRLIAEVKLDSDKYKAILFKLSVKRENRVDIIDVWLPRKQIEMRDGQLWATPWIIERKEEELSRETFHGEVVELAKFDGDLNG